MRRLLLLIFSVALTGITYGQCTITAFPESLTYNCDDSVQVNFSVFADFALNNDFNLGVAGAGWQATSSAQFNNPFVPNDGSTYLWMGDQADVPRALTSNPLDLSLGGLICFDLAYAIQGNATPVEGPDESDEGVSLQYSTDGGTTWVDIAYFQPDGQILPANPGNGGPGATGMTPFTSWGNYCFPIPAGAFGGMTQIQWVQEQSSTANFDHWGLDNIEVFVADTTYDIVNVNTGVVLDSTVDFVYGISDTTYTFIYTNGIDDTCMTSIDLELNPTDAGPDIIAACDGIGVTIDVLGVSPWSIVSWNPTTGLDDGTSPSPFANPISDTQYIVTSNCGEDTVLIDVVPTFDVNVIPPDSICIGGFATLETVITPSSVPIATYLWESATTLNTDNAATVLATPNTSTTYTVTATSDEGCIRETTTTVNVSSDAIFMNLVNDSALVCAGDTVNASVNVLSPNPGVPYILIPTPYEVLVPTGPVLPVNFTSGEGVSNITLPFPFTYFGLPVTQGSLSSNGWFSFSPAFNADNSADNIPTVTGVDNMIAFAWDDLNPSAGGTVSAYILGTAPNQSFVIEFLDVPYEGDFETVSIQIVLYEGSNVIQFNVIEIQNSGFAMNMTMGIENLTGNSGLALPGRNAADFSAAMESWQFIPYNAPTNVTYTWAPSPFLQNTTPQSANLFPQVDTFFPVTATTSQCEAIDSIFVDVDEFDVEAGNDTTICVGDTATLTATIVDAPLVCVEQYNVASIPVNMLAPVNPTFVNLSDDAVSPSITMPFSLEFFCSNKNSFGISSNGFISFEAAPDNGCCSGEFLPNAGAFEPSDLIALHWNDLNPSNGGTISHWVTGTAPNRIYVVEFDNVPHFGGGGSNITGQIQMYEGSNIVQVHVVTGTSDGSIATLGLENAASTQAATAPGRNGVNYSSSNEAWSFIPANSLGNFNFAWTPNQFLTDTAGNTTGAYPTVTSEYFVTATNLNGCSYTDSVSIIITEGMIAGDATICEGDTTPLIASGAGSYLWSPNDGSIADVNAALTVAYPTTTTTYIVTFNPNSCPEQDSVVVTVSPAPTVTINNGVTPAAFCEGLSVDLVAAPNNATWTYNWTGPEQGTGSTLTVGTAGPYVLFFTDDNGCTNFANISVAENANPTFDFNSLRNVLCCTDDEVFIEFDATTVTNGETIASFTVNGNTETAPFSVVSGTGTQTFAIVATTDNGCEGTTSIDVVTNCIDPSIAAIPELFVDASANFDLTTTNATNYSWGVTPTGQGIYTDDAVEDPEYTPTLDGDYTAYVDVEAVYLLNDSSDYSCFETDSAAFFVTSIAEAMIPDAFTPNGDGDNDIFFEVNTLPTNNSIDFFRVYNRWGSIVYSYTGSGNGWDGNYQGTLQPNDTYQYIINIDKADGTQQQFQGDVTLIR